MTKRLWLIRHLCFGWWFWQSWLEVYHFSISFFTSFCSSHPTFGCQGEHSKRKFLLSEIPKCNNHLLSI